MGPGEVGIYTKDNVQQILISTHIQATFGFDWMEGEIPTNECNTEMSFKLVKVNLTFHCAHGNALVALPTTPS